MEEGYDFSNAERGKFYREGAIMITPAYLDKEVTRRLSKLAKAKGVYPSDLANEIVRRALPEMEAAIAVGGAPER
jgi:hypothetical protein